MVKTFKDYLQEAIVASKYHCKDCGDTMHKPTTDCSHDSHNEKGRHWIDDNGNGIHDLDESDELDNLNIDDPDDEENPLAGDNDLRKLYSRKEKANLKKKYDAMMAKENLGLEEAEELSMCCDAPISDGDGDADGRCTSCGEVVRVEEGMARGIGTLDKFRELYRKGIGSDDDAVVLKELIEVINDDALQDDFPQLKSFTSASEFDGSEIVTANDVPGNSADEKIMSLIKAIDDDEWVESFVITLMKDFNMSDNEELDRIKELAGASIDETYDDDDDFYEAYGEMWYNEDDIMDEAEYQGRKVKLGKPMQGDVKKFKVYVKDPKTGNVKKVNFGHGGSSVKGKAMKIKKSNPARRKSFRARHNCDNPGPRTKARYWSCRKW